MNVSLTPELEAFIEKEVKTGIESISNKGDFNASSPLL
jgi:hypothetical protein